MSCMTMAASNGGKASSNRKAVTNCAQTKNGNRIQVNPFARNWMIVVIKLTAPSSDEVIRKMKPMSQRVWPLKNRVEPRTLVRNISQWRVRGPSALGRATGNEKTAHHDDRSDEEGPETRGS